MTQLFANNAASTLNGGITEDTTDITLQTGDGTRFPSPSNGDWFNVTVFQRDGGKEINHEIMRVTSRTGDVLSVLRQQEGTTKRSFNNGDFIELRLTAAMDTNKMTLAQMHAVMFSF